MSSPLTRGEAKPVHPRSPRLVRQSSSEDDLAKATAADEESSELLCNHRPAAKRFLQYQPHGLVLHDVTSAPQTS
jgi:hypothetical protein